MENNKNQNRVKTSQVFQAGPTSAFLSSRAEQGWGQKVLLNNIYASTPKSQSFSDPCLAASPQLGCGNQRS